MSFEPAQPLPAELDWALWRHCLGLPSETDIAQVLRAAQQRLEETRWHPIGSCWPDDGQSVLVALHLESTGQRWTRQASFHEPLCKPLSLFLPTMVNGVPEKEDYPIDYRSSSLNDLQKRSAGPGFSMGGGDWDVQFSGPRFALRGMGYGEKPDEPWHTITHWSDWPSLPIV